MNAGTAKFEKSAAACAQYTQVILAVGVELPCPKCLIVPHQPVYADHVIQCATLASTIDKNEVVEKWIEAVTFEPLLMVYQSSVPAKLGHEDVVAQALRGEKVGLVGS